MRPEDKKKFEEILEVTSEVLDKKLSKAARGMYFNALKRFSIQEIGLACSKATETLDWMPKPSQIIKIIEGCPKENQQALDDSAILAANEAWDLLGRPHKRDRAPQKIKATIRTLGGWESQRMVEDKDEPFWKKRFIEAYKACSNEKAVEMLEDNSGSIDSLVDGLVAEKLVWRK